MRFSMTALFLIITILILSIFVANLANIVSTDKELLEKLENADQNWTQSGSQETLTTIDHRPDHLMWFIQISDIHISVFSDPERISQFKEFINVTIDTIKPKVVLASGDLTDARVGKTLASRQFIDEWKIYKSALDEGDISSKTVWLDIRGNHDTFNVPVSSPIDYFHKYSIQGDKYKRSYLYQVREGTETYSFIAVDACLEPGVIRPLNFFGLLDKNETSHLIDLNDRARRNGGNYTIWFGHYPTSCILSPGTGKSGLRGIIGQYKESYAYLCGHLHTQGGLITRMHTLQHAGFLELELGDWKSNRLFRVAAFDHGLFSFIDVEYNDWPIILITNPKHALYNIPHREDLSLQIQSTHIRLLIFTPSKVSRCAVKINDEKWESCENVNGNLFVVPWNSLTYKNGLHNLEVYVHTADGKSKTITQPFSLSGNRLSFELLARFVLMTDICQLFQALFGISLSLCVVPMCVTRILHELVLAKKCTRPNVRKLKCCNRFIKRLWILSTVDRILIPLLCFFLYIAVGPWSVHELVEGKTGVVFIWGVFVDGAYLPGSLTYLYGFFQLIFCQFPLLFVYANNVYAQYLKLCSMEIQKNTSLAWKFYKHFPFVFVITVEAALATFFLWSYGFLAFLLGTLRTWSIVFNIIMWYVSVNVPENSLRSAMSVWNS